MRNTTLNTTCTTCGKAAANPYRVYSAQGQVIQGCVDAAHDGHLVTPSESALWHNRTEAKAVRRAAATHTKALFSRKGVR